MSGPYVYTPSAFEPTLNFGAYYIVIQGSPYTPHPPLSASHSPPTSPNLGPSSPQGFHVDDPYWHPHRSGKPSSHCGTPPSPSLATSSTPGYYRKRSFAGDLWQSEPSPPRTSSASHFQVHRRTRVSVSEETTITCACARGGPSPPSSAEVHWASQTTQRINYYLEEHACRGVTRTYDEDGYYHWSLSAV